MLEAFQKWFSDHRDQIYEDFFQFLRFPSVSTDPAFHEGMRACVDWLQKYVEAFGFQTEIWETSGHPTLFAQNLDAGPDQPTLLIYLHYDVQPVVPLEEWESDPFEPVVKKGKVVARGAIDNKGQCFYTLSALRAFDALGENFGINVKLCIEGEEEVGSPGLEGILEEKKQDLQADYFMVVDMEMLGESAPAVVLGMRGIATVNLECQNSSQDLHSGMFGGIVMNPARALAKALANCWDEEGCIQVPGFYEGMKEFTKEELEAFYWDFDAKGQASPFDVKTFDGEKGYSLLESNWIRPTLEINGMESGYTGDGFKTIIPAKASVKLSCRLVQGQDPKEVLQRLVDFLKKKLPTGIDVKVEWGHGSSGLVTTPNSPFAQKVVRALEAVFQQPCRRILCGATIPIVPPLTRVSGAQLVMTGVGLPEDGMHAPNESFALGRFEKGFLSIIRILQELK